MAGNCDEPTFTSMPCWSRGQNAPGSICLASDDETFYIVWEKDQFVFESWGHEVKTWESAVQDKKKEKSSTSYAFAIFFPRTRCCSHLHADC